MRFVTENERLVLKDKEDRPVITHVNCGMNLFESGRIFPLLYDHWTDNGNGVLVYSAGIKEIWTFSEGSDDPVVEQVYSDGSGFFTLDDRARLVWADQKGDIPLDTKFIFVG